MGYISCLRRGLYLSPTLHRTHFKTLPVTPEVFLMKHEIRSQQTLLEESWVVYFRLCGLQICVITTQFCVVAWNTIYGQYRQYVTQSAWLCLSKTLFIYLFIYLFIVTYSCLKKLQVFLFFKLFIYLLAALGLHCCTQAFSSCGEWGLLFVAVHGLLRAHGAGSVVVVNGLICSSACGIFPDQDSNPCPLHWQADS